MDHFQSNHPFTAAPYMIALWAMRLTPRGRPMVAPTTGTVDIVGADIIRPVILEHKITSPPGDNARAIFDRQQPPVHRRTIYDRPLGDAACAARAIRESPLRQVR